MRMGAGALGLGLLIVLLLSPVSTEAIWGGRNEEAATAAEAAKEYAKGAVRNTADAASNVGNSIKQTANAAFETAGDGVKVVTGGGRDRSSSGPTGAAYRDRAGNYIAEAATAAQRRAADAAAAVRDTPVGTAQAARDTAAWAYDATADTSSSAMNRVRGKQDPEPTYTQRAADAARRAAQNMQDGAARTYETTTAPVRDHVMGYGQEDNRGIFDKARDTVTNAAYRTGDSLSRVGQATRDTAYRTAGYEAPSDRGYASRAYDYARDTSSDAYETGKNKLGSIIEILGWHKAADDDHSYLRNYSPYDVIVGNTRYVWHQAPESESFLQRARSKVAGVTEPVVEKASQAANTVYDAAGRAKESTGDMAGKTGEAVSDYSQKGKEVLAAGAAAVGADKIAKPGFWSKFWRFMHLLTWGVSFGTAVWMTFMSGRVLSQSMPGEQFRQVQTKMFPSYLRFLTSAEGSLTFLYMLMSIASKWQILNLLILTSTTAYNAYVLEPETTKLYLERMKLEKEEGKGLTSTENNVGKELAGKNKRFKELHGYSASLNLLSLAGLAYHAWNLLSKLHT
ncbi:uncharacterized protein [Physcomitrium patens]